MIYFDLLDLEVSKKTFKFSVVEMFWKNKFGPRALLSFTYFAASSGRRYTEFQILFLSFSWY
jgi:hypothetical protein